jgi:hypothetical protein
MLKNMKKQTGQKAKECEKSVDLYLVPKILLYKDI